MPSPKPENLSSRFTSPTSSRRLPHREACRSDRGSPRSAHMRLALPWACVSTATSLPCLPLSCRLTTRLSWEPWGRGEAQEGPIMDKGSNSQMRISDDEMARLLSDPEHLLE